MTKYMTLAAITLPVGMVIGLADAQAAARKHVLAPAAGKGQWVTRDLVQFKAGESISIEGDLPKNLLGTLEAEAKPKRTRAAGQPDTVAGSKGADLLTGGSGSDSAAGGAGNDTPEAGA